MGKFSISKLVLKISKKIKPLLIRVVPIGVLRRLKRALVLRSMARFGKKTSNSFMRGIGHDGVNIIGSVKDEVGLGQSCRLICGVMNKHKIPFTIIEYSPISSVTSGDMTWDSKITNKAYYNINLIHINPQDMPLVFLQLDEHIFNRRYNIAFWLWELEDFPDEWTPCFNYLDEIWTPAEFVSESIRKKTKLPVKTVPYAIDSPVDSRFDRAYFSLPQDKFLVLIMGNPGSVIERKNPNAAIGAFKSAFSPKDGSVGLVIKINVSKKSDLDEYRQLLSEYDNIYFITETLSKTGVNSLIKCVDVFVSLHRAEGFGLVLAEAMALGTPTIATNWSANTEFIAKDTACAVDYRLIEIERDIGPYKKGCRWADPDINQAAEYMKRLYGDRGFYRDISENAKKHIAEKLSSENAAALVRQRMDEIYAKYPG